MNLGLYVRTLRHLRAGQLAARLRTKLPRRKPSAPDVTWRGPEQTPPQDPQWREQTLFENLTMRFHGRTIAWGERGLPALLAYHVHYHDDLNRELLRRWMAEFPPGSAPAWDPYPTSLRIVNWIRWLLRNAPEEGMLRSLGHQAEWLSHRVEWDVRANHLLTNGKALLFAGAAFEGSAADRWLRLGLSILTRQLDEQILADGGHYERSPMYHSIVLADLLELESLRRAYPQRLAALPPLAPRITAMLRWLSAMTHPDGEIALFNDAAFDVAAPPHVLQQWSAGVSPAGPAASSPPLTLLRESGYCRLERGDAVLIADVGEIGPDEQPGHAHADTFSFEFSLHGERVIVDAGTSNYENSAQRAWERSTPAHNTVSIDGGNSSEVWSTFRVGRRAHVRDVSAAETQTELTVKSCHDGFRGALHCRTWRLRDRELVIEDRLSAKRNADAYLHFAPGTKLVLVDGGADAATAGLQQMQIRVDGARVSIVPSSYHPRFGVAIANEALRLTFDGVDCTTRLRWS